MHPEDNFRPLPNCNTHQCFACSPVNPSGLQMEFFSDGQTVVSRLTVPRHVCGWHRAVHGGIISTIMDECMAWAGIYLLKKITLTKTITVDFHKVIVAGDELTAESRVVSTTGNREALMAATLHNRDGVLCAEASATFTLISPKLAKRLQIMDDVHVKTFFEPLIAD